uniref:Uncharacterized protein n=1 Tax=Pithovirus LCPAC104 TaxID=2506589 RepID=A0A481Z7J8_9VIRU|nr:MAG: hypothetical protein LCPAC104_01680 [Pithovirus LCPAC104]
MVFNKEDFINNLYNFINLCLKIIEKDKKNNPLKYVDSNGINIEFHLEKYMKLYEVSIKRKMIEKHKEVFNKFFKEYPFSGMKSYSDDEFIKNGNICIIFGDKEMESGGGIIKDNPFIIHLSLIYNISLILSKKAIEITEKKEDEEINNFPEINYPLILLLYLYKIFDSIIDDNVKIKEIIKSIKDEVGGSDNVIDSMNGMNNKLTKGIGTIVELAKTFAGGMGLEVPDDVENSVGEITKTITKIISNSNTKNLLGSIVSNTKKSGNINDIIQNTFNDTGFRNSLMETIKSTTESSISSSSKMVTSEPDEEISYLDKV